MTIVEEELSNHNHSYGESRECQKAFFSLLIKIYKCACEKAHRKKSIKTYNFIYIYIYIF